MVWQYSATLLASLPAAFPAMRYIDTHNYLVTFLGTASQVLAGWLRYIAIREENFSLVIVSSVLIGFGGSVIISTYTTCAQRWFPPHERTLATSIAVQSNYFGWAMGSVIVPSIVNEPGSGSFDVIKEQFLNLALWQAVGCSLCLVTFFAFHRETPKSYKKDMATAEERDTSQAQEQDEEVGASFASGDGRSMTAGRRSQSGVAGRASYSRGACASSVYRQNQASSVQIPALKSAWMLATNGQFMMQGFCYAVLGGVSYTIPAVQDEVFADIGYTSQENSLTNFCFIMTGVCCGVLLGYVGKDRRRHGVLLKFLFSISAVSLTVLLVLTDLRKRNIDVGLNNAELRPIFIICMGGAGAGTLSFIGIALQKAVDLTQPVSEAIAGGMVEWFLNNFAAIIPLVDANTFWASTAVTVFVTLLFLAFYSENESSRTSMHSHHQSMMSEHQSMRPDTTGRIEMSEADPVSSPNVTNNKGANKDPQIVSFTSGEERSHTQAQAQAQNTSPQNPLLTDEEAGLASTAPPVALV
jgi:MFS family permease